MAQQPRLDVGRLQRLAQKSVLAEIELCSAEIVRGAEMGFDVSQALLGWGHR